MAMAAILVMWPGQIEQFCSPSHRSSKWNLTLIGPVVSEEKMFKECGRRRTMKAYLSYKITKWAFGSGELIGAVTGQHSSTESHLANKTKLFLSATKKQCTTKYIGHCDLLLLLSQSLYHTNLLSQRTCMMFIHETLLKIRSKITGPCNVGQCDLYLLWGQSLHHTVSLSETQTFIHETHFKIWSKINRPWNSYCDPCLQWVQSFCQTDFIHQIAFKK